MNPNCHAFALLFLRESFADRGMEAFLFGPLPQRFHLGPSLDVVFFPLFL